MISPVIVAHRGLSAVYPENTRLAIAQAVTAGARAVEFDVQLTADRVPVLFHDATLERMLGEPGWIMECPWRQLRTLRTRGPDRGGVKDSGVPIATLAEIADYLQQHPQVLPCIELKTECIEYFGLESCLDAIIKTAEPLLERALLLSFSQAAIEWLHRQGLRRTGWVLTGFNINTRAIAETLQTQVLICDQTRLPATAAGLWSGPWDWMAYQTADPERIRQLRQLGIRYIETDNIQAVAATLPEFFID